MEVTLVHLNKNTDSNLLNIFSIVTFWLVKRDTGVEWDQR